MACVAAPPLDWDALLREVARRRALIERFRRTMRRHERRARRDGFGGAAEVLRGVRLGVCRSRAVDVGWWRLAEDMRGWAAEDRQTRDDGANAATAFLLAHAADAVARLRADLGGMR